MVLACELLAQWWNPNPPTTNRESPAAMSSCFAGCDRELLVRGAGFFNDAYDLFVMNIVNVVLRLRFPDAYDASVCCMLIRWAVGWLLTPTPTPTNY